MYKSHNPEFDLVTMDNIAQKISFFNVDHQINLLTYSLMLKIFLYPRFTNQKEHFKSIKKIIQKKKEVILYSYKIVQNLSFVDIMFFSFVLKIFNFDAFVIDFINVILQRDDPEVNTNFTEIFQWTAKLLDKTGTLPYVFPKFLGKEIYINFVKNMTTKLNMNKCTSTMIDNQLINSRVTPQSLVASLKLDETIKDFCFNTDNNFCHEMDLYASKYLFDLYTPTRQTENFFRGFELHLWKEDDILKDPVIESFIEGVLSNHMLELRIHFAYKFILFLFIFVQGFVVDQSTMAAIFISSMILIMHTLHFCLLTNHRLFFKAP